jgi:hypothetical protein
MWRLHASWLYMQSVIIIELTFLEGIVIHLKETQITIKSSTIGQPALRCFTNSVIGHHVQSILTTQHKEKENSGHDLPPAQNILVVWGRFVPWCWACAEEVGRDTVMSLVRSCIVCFMDVIG